MSSTLGHSLLPSANAKKPRMYQKSCFTSCKVAKESAEVEESSDGSEVPEKTQKSGPPDKDVAYGSPSNTTNFSDNYQSQAFEGFESEDALVSMLNTSGKVPPMCLQPPVFDISSDDTPPSPQSDMPSQLLNEVQKINDPLNIPEACPGDFLHVWDATDVHTILLALPDGGKDPMRIARVSVSHLAKEMRWGCCGALGIIEGLSFFAETRGLNLEQFEVKILKLWKALAHTIDGQSPASGSVEWKSTMQSSRSAVKSPIPPLIATPASLCLPSKPAATVREPPPSLSHGLHSRKPAGTIEVPFEVRYDQMVPGAFENEPNVSHNHPNTNTNLDDDFDEEEEDDDILHESQAGSADNNCCIKQYKTGPLPVELLEEVWAITDAFDHTLVVTAEKYNCPLATVHHLANLEGTIHAKCLPNPFNGLSSLLNMQRRRGNMRMILKVDNDVALTTGSKLAKFISQKKKNLMGEMSHMGPFNVHSISFIVCGRADAYVAHAQNAILCSSPEIQQLAKEEFNLKKTLDDLFVKVLAQWSDVRGLSKWHQETEKKQQEDELRSHDSAYSAASKYLQNLFIENGHTWFPALVPWSWEGGQWCLLVSEFHKGKGCPIKLEKWSDDDADNDDDIPLIIDCNRVIVYHVQDANSGAGPEGGQKLPSKELLSTWAQSKLPAHKPHGPSGSGASSKGKNSKASHNLSKAFIENSDSEDLGPDLVNGTETTAKLATNPSSGLTEPNVGDTIHSYFGTLDNLNWEPGTVTNGNPSLAIGPMNLNFGATDLNLGASTLGSTNPGVVPQNCCYTKHSEVRPSENLSTMHQVQNKGPLGPLV
ncbi:hypothetical protein BS47DRAFT_1369022 [Hydnum rufescens UP504]|uniref:Uncharacterized protein n=1 Tax=Hydnum rufescens UP504 TaxID=1448309 RepID=A0A9P6DMC5_9AGAM|nr:hypothetical protein BS47DRAFT_1369022 [Hydnum rufescens UP504]